MRSKNKLLMWIPGSLQLYCTSKFGDVIDTSDSVLLFLKQKMLDCYGVGGLVFCQLTTSFIS
jgi:hypothetical protein